MILSWKNFLSSHPFNDDLNNNAFGIQTIFLSANTPTQKFTKLCEYKNLLLLSRSVIDTDVQTTFYHSTRNDSFTQAQPFYHALLGLGTRATVVRMDPDKIFVHSAATKAVPSMDTFLKCTTVDEIKAAATSTSREFIQNFAVLPPFLASTLFELDDWTADRIFLLLKDHISQRRTLLLAAKNPPAPPTTADPNTNDDNVVTQSQTPNQTNTNTTAPASLSDDELEEETKTFHNILIFLWSLIKDEPIPTPLSIPVCTKDTTATWLDEQHKICINANNTSLPSHQQQPSALAHIISEYTKLATSLLDQQNNTKQTEKEMLKFDKLPVVSKNVIRMMPLIDGQDQEDIAALEPSENFVILINQGSPAGVQSLFQHEFDCAGLLGHVPLGLSTSIKNGALITFPSASSLAGLCVFFCHPHALGQEFSAEEILRITEQANYGKHQRDGIELMTKSKPFIPYDFSSFLHMLKNITFICEYLGGPHCMTATAWRTAVQHASTNKLTYREEQQKDKLFYASVLDDYNRRFQTFLRSCAFAKADKLRRNQLDFETICTTIETFGYQTRQPIWMKKRDAENNHSFNPSRDNNKRQRQAGLRPDNRNKVINDDIDDKMHLPNNTKFGDVFKPENRNLTPSLPHADGSIRCLNYHHRGFCWSNCNFINSHNKKLTSKEIEDGRKYLQNLLNTFNTSKNSAKPVAPRGMPPAADPVPSSMPIPVQKP